MMNTVILSRCRLFSNKTLEILSHSRNPGVCLSMLNMPTVLHVRSTATSPYLKLNSLNCLFHVSKMPRRGGIEQSKIPALNETIPTLRKRHFCLGIAMLKPVSDSDVKRAMEALTTKFMEARELLSDARESEGTVYFSEDMEDAQQAVRETVDEYSELLSKLSEEQRQDVVRTIGLKMEELKAQLQAIVEELKEDH